MTDTSCAAIKAWALDCMHAQRRLAEEAPAGGRQFHDDRAALFRAVAALAEREAWRTIDSAPRDGTPVDLWLVGPDDTVDFYAPVASKIKGKPLRAGRGVAFRWMHRPPNEPGWHPLNGLGYGLSPDVTPTHWRPLPAPPKGG